jgi:hypothetical protein
MISCKYWVQFIQPSWMFACQRRSDFILMAEVSRECQSGSEGIPERCKNLLQQIAAGLRNKTCRIEHVVFRKQTDCPAVSRRLLGGKAAVTMPDRVAWWLFSSCEQKESQHERGVSADAV